VLALEEDNNQRLVEQNFGKEDKNNNMNGKSKLLINTQL
jgi:hypothetical protein